MLKSDFRWEGKIKVALLWMFVVFSFLQFLLFQELKLLEDFEVAFLSLQKVIMVCILLWCIVLFYLVYSWNDLPLIAFLVIGSIVYFLGASWQIMDAVVLLFGALLGRWTKIILLNPKQTNVGYKDTHRVQKIIRNTLIVLVSVLACSSWWHLNISYNYYHGPRWMGLWDNPNTYGMLMGSGVASAAGLLTGMKNTELRMNKWLSFALCIATGMMSIGLVMSYSRGAWLATSIGLLYLAWYRSKLKWCYVLLGAGLVAWGALLLWSRTPDFAPWYIKRADLGRPSAQHRATAWWAGLEIMRDHPFGVGWNNAVSVYEKNYSPPKDGAAAITTNDYLMVGTELGIPALLCFITYVVLQLRVREKAACEDTRPTTLDFRLETLGSKSACRAGAIVFLVGFWFDGGLFKLPTAAMFWVLLELGSNPHQTKISTLQPT